MKDKKYKYFKIPVILLTFFLLALFFGCNNKESDNNDLHKGPKVIAENKKSEKPIEFAVEPPPFSDGIFPCMSCHANFKPNPVKRELVDWHDDISAMLKHGEDRWCLDCHDLKNRDSLKLASGKLLDFKESYKLCGQCHGEKLRDWKVGVHGKRTGEWNGKKTYFLCVNCHNPHSPKFQPLTPDLPPVRQEDIK